VKIFTVLLLGVILPILITIFGFNNIIESFGAEEIPQNKHNIETVYTINPKYQIHHQGIMRNANGHLINVTENMIIGAFLPHKIPDNLFDNLMGEREIVTVDGIMYEKIEYEVSVEHPEITSKIVLCGSDADCVIFKSHVWWLPSETGDTLTTKWSVLREL
tara:strand:+ start:318 stop:800 length:483 start_codon:yes stop_codon:yes gene_type:complete